MSYPYARINVESAGNILTAANYNAEHDNHITNNIPASVDDYSANATQSNTSSDPGAVGAETLAVALSQEIEQLRYVLGRIIGGVTGGWRDVAPISLSNLTNDEIGKISNLGLNLTSGVLTIKGADGSALSASNPGYVTVPSSTAGQFKTLKVTAGGVLQDDVASPSYMTNLEFGITASANWGSDMPFFLYVVNRANSDLDGVDGSSMFFLARNPCLTSTPSSSNDIGNNTTIPVNDTQNVILILGNVTIGNYTSLPCQLIGSIRMQYLTASHDWTIQSLNSSDGIGYTQLDRTFAKLWTFPTGQNGAASGSYLIANGSTVPTFATQSITYLLNRNGTAKVDFHLLGDGGVAGVGANNADLTMPYTLTQTTSDITVGTGELISASSAVPAIFGTIANTPALAIYGYNTSGGVIDDTTGRVKHNAFTAGQRAIAGQLTMKVF